MSADILLELATTIRQRRAASGEKSYTRQLLDSGPERCARKFGEEALEAVIAGVKGDKRELTAEAADVVYHLLVLLEAREIALTDVLDVLTVRTKQSGLAEKASRKGPGAAS
jgi:phosphoribosyl-ATP pyrophosphohydrolase